MLAALALLTIFGGIFGMGKAFESTKEIPSNDRRRCTSEVGTLSIELPVGCNGRVNQTTLTELVNERRSRLYDDY
jgi:hypothetical protein